MKFFNFFCIAALAVTISTVSAIEQEAVVALTTDTFDEFIKTNKVALVEFYAPWCGHCQRLAPEYEKAAQILAKANPPVKLAKIDATQEDKLAERFGVRGYPTIKWFRNGQAEEYEGGRTEQKIVEWVERNTGPAVKEVGSTKEVEALKKDHSVVFVCHVKSKDSSKAKHFAAVADAKRDAGTFVLLVDNDAKDDITVYRHDEDPETTSASSENDIGNFVDEESFALFGAINGENFAKYTGRPQELVWLPMTKGDYTKYGKSVREVAKHQRKDHLFAWLDTDQFGSHAESSLGVSEYPALVLQRKAGRYVYPGKDFHDTKSLKQFFTDVSSGKIKRSIKSEPIPEPSDEAVVTVVANNFEDVVLDTSKDVLLEVYAPWCGHCKKLEPIYKELAEKLKDDDSVIIAKMDGTANEVPVENFDWSGFPTIFWVKGGAKVPEKYKGARTLEAMHEFVTKNKRNSGDKNADKSEL